MRTMMNRRHWLAQGAGALGGMAWAATPLPSHAESRNPWPWPELTLFVPAIPGESWDQVAHAMGAALQSAGLVERVSYENLGGRAGTVGLSAFAERHKGHPRALMVSGMTMLGGMAVRQWGAEQMRASPLAGLITDALIVAVPTASPLQMVQDLAIRLRDPAFRATVVGGPAGSVDHMLLGMMVRAVQGAPEHFTYLATAGGAEVRAALVTGMAQFGIASYSELREALQAGALRALAVSASRSEFGLPTLRESGINTVLSDWCGVFAPPGLTPEQHDALEHVVTRMALSGEWKNQMRTRQWQSAFQTGVVFRQFVETELASARLVVNLLKLQG